MKKSPVYSILLGLILIACSDQNPSNGFDLNSFALTKNLIGEKKLYDDILMPEDIIISNDKIVISDRGGKSLMHVLERSTLDYLYPKGLKGSGPGEQEGLRRLDAGDGENYFYAYDEQLKKLLKYSLQDTVKHSVQEIKQTEKWYFAVNPAFLDSDRFVSNTIGASKFEIYDSSGTLLEKYGLWSQMLPEVNDDYIVSDLYQGNFSGNPSKGNFVLACALVDHFEILDLNKGEIISIDGPINKGIDFKINGRGNNSAGLITRDQKLGFNGVFVGDKYIFLVYIGRTMEEYARDQYASKDIFQFSLNGDPLAHYTLDIPIKTIAVDENSNTIYAVSDDKNPGLVVYKY